MKKVGRPERPEYTREDSCNLQVRLTKEEKEKLDYLRKHTRYTTSDVIRKFISDIRIIDGSVIIPQFKRSFAHLSREEAKELLKTLTEKLIQ